MAKPKMIKLSGEGVCAVCHKEKQDCIKVLGGKSLVCAHCLGIYNEVRTIVLEANPERMG